MRTIVGFVFSGAAAALFVGGFLVCYLRSRGQYDEYMEYLEEGEYSFKDLIPLGLYLSEVLDGKSFLPLQAKAWLARRKNQVNQKILELRGPRNAEFYQYIHGGYRLTAALVMAAMASLMGLIFNLQGDVSNGILLSVLSVAAFLGVPFLMDSSLEGKLKERRLAIQLEFPEFINKLTLLVNAGMTISGAWEKIILENKKPHILYEEMHYALMEIKAGKPEAAAYEAFARRCRVKEVTKFVSVIVMNLRRGGTEVVPVLRAQGEECWEMRKNAARQLGEEAGTKIMLPMMLMFLGILMVVATPAVLGMASGM